MQRAWRTAELIGDELGIGPVQPADDLAEREVGPWTGLTFEEIDLTWPGALQRREWPEGFEDDDAIVERGVAAVTDAGGPPSRRDRAGRHPRRRAPRPGTGPGALAGPLHEPLGVLDVRRSGGRAGGGKITFGERVWLSDIETGGRRSLSGLARTAGAGERDERVTEQA